MQSNYARLASCALAISPLAVLLAGCGSSQEEQSPSQGEQTSQEETTAAPVTTGEPTTAQGGDAIPQTVATAEAFLATLDDAQREQATFEFDDELKTN